MRCADCKFWEARSSDLGECRRHPPVLLTAILDVEEAPVTPEVDPGDLENMLIHSAWPVTNFALWCGEFKSV